MDWSNEERAKLEELQEMPSFALTPEARQAMWGRISRRVQKPSTIRKQRALYVSVAGVAAVAVLSVGLWKSNLSDSPAVHQGATVAPPPSSISAPQPIELKVRLQIVPPNGETLTPKDINAVMEVLQKRVQSAGVKECKIDSISPDQLDVDAKGIFDADQVRQLLVHNAKLEFKSDAGTVLMTANDVKAATTMSDPQSKQTLVQVEFTDRAKVEQITSANIGKQMPVWLDGQLLVSPTVQTVIANGKLTISGLDKKSAQQLAALLNGGMLPDQVKELSASK